MSQTLKESINLKPIIIWSLIIWFLAFIYSTILMLIIGVDFNDADLVFGPGHPLYWKFESIMQPSFLVVGILLFAYHFHRSPQYSSNWKVSSLIFGVGIMICQFILDTIVLVIAMGNSFSYFLGMVSISYILIPVWSLLVGWYMFERK